MFGCAAALLGERAKPVVDFIGRVNDIIFKMMGFVVKLAPLGVFGAIAFTVGKYGIGSLKQLGVLVLLFYVVGAAVRLRRAGRHHAAVRLQPVQAAALPARGADHRARHRVGRQRAAADHAQAASSSASSDSTVGLVIPTGYSFNLDAFSIYLTLAAVFIAQATNTPLAIGDLLAILGVALLTSKGAHGVPGSAIVVLAATLAAMPAIPAIGLVLVLSVDWFMGIARALGNYIGNCVATVAIASWEGDIDRERAHRVLNGEIDPAAATAGWRRRPRPRRRRAAARLSRAAVDRIDRHVDAADCTPDQGGLCAVRPGDRDQGCEAKLINDGFAQRFDGLAQIDVAAEGGAVNISLFDGSLRPSPILIKLMERHPLGSQLFMPLNEKPWLVLVCADPRVPASYRAFSATGQQGVNYARNIWHHPLLVLTDASPFLVVDRGGPGDNLEEVRLAGSRLACARSQCRLTLERP